MDDSLGICLLNDSFPPTVDGVANTVLNYATVIDKKYGDAYVVVPKYPDAEDDYPFEVLRYRSFDVEKVKPYRVGYPLDSRPAKTLIKRDVDIIHTHCPIASAMLGRSLKKQLNVPMVLTYHTKFDVDFRKVIKNKLFYETALKVMIDNVNACDDVWVVSKGAGDNLRSLGYKGEYTVMKNGVDFPKGRADEGEVAAIRSKYSLHDDCLNLLFVGRMMWYKGLRIILDAVNMCKVSGVRVKILFVGNGNDFDEVTAYASALGLTPDDCVFVGAVHDRERLRAFYGACDLFVFPSSFDTNGLVVSEAAACYVPSVVLRGSCAAEEIHDGQNGFLCNENPASLYLTLSELYAKKEKIREVGRNAADSLYLSWDDAVATAVERYRLIKQCAESGEFPVKKTDFGGFYSIVSSMQKNNRRMNEWRGKVNENYLRWFRAVIKR